MSKRKQQIRKTAAAPAAKPGSDARRDESSFPVSWLAGLVVLTGLVFWPMLRHQFTNWDDEAYVVNNALLQGPDWRGIFTEPVVSNYHPLTVLTLALNYQWSKLEPFSYLLVNWLLHLANTGLVFYLAWLLSGRGRWVALFTALVFAVHPMHVESVAWISERKDVLYTFFYLLALLYYWRYLVQQRRKDYWITFVFFLLSLLSKPAAVVLPLSLLLLDYWRERRWERRVWLEKAPFFAFSMLFGVLTLLIQSEKAIAPLEKYSVADRFFFGCYGLVMYVARFFAPAPLSAFHPYPAPGEFSLAIRLAPLGVVALGALVWYFRRQKALVFGTLFYVVNIILVVQFISIGNTLLSERYTYVPYIGLAFALAMLLTNKRGIPFSSNMQIRLGVLIALSFGYLSRRHVPVWATSETLWTDVIRHYPGTPIPHSNRANYRYQQYLKPANAQKAAAYLSDALADCNAALATRPDYYPALDIRSIIYMRQGQYQQALDDANRMVAGKPDDKKSYVVRGSAYGLLQRYDDALADYNRALTLEPNDPDALNGRGTALFNGKQQYREALADFDKAISLKADGGYYLNRSRCHFMLRDLEQARADAQTAQELGTAVPPDYLKALR